MKNKFHRLLLYFGLFFLFIGVLEVNAASKSITILENDKSAFVLSGINYSNLRCGSNEEIKNPGDKLTLKYVTVKMLDGGDIVASWIDEKKLPEGTVTDSLVCKYDNSYTSSAGAGAGETTITFSYMKLNQNLEFNFSLDQQKNTSKDLGSALSFKTVTKKEIKSGSQYIDLNCGGTICKVSVKSNVTIPDSGTTAKIYIEFVGTDGNTHKLSSVINITSTLAVMAYGGDYGKCDWSSVSTKWEKYSDPVGNASSSENTRRFILKNVNSTIQFPNCDNSNSAVPFLKFKKWVTQGNGYATGTDIMSSDTCTKFKSSSEVAPSVDNYRYFACYATEDATLLFAGNGKLDSSDSNTKVWNYSENNYYYSTSKKVSLPNVIPNSSSLTNVKFLGWSTLETGECADDPNLKAAGTIVNSDGTTYSACYSMGYENQSSENKTINVGENEWLIPVNLKNGTVLSCNSLNSEYISASASGGKCLVQGLKTTNGERYDVKVEGSDKEIYVFHIEVRTKDGLTELGDGYIIDGSTGSTIDNSEFGERTDVQTVDCNQFSVNVDSNTRREDGEYIGKGNNLELRAHLYTASAKCEGKTIKYVGVCIDPGRQEPTSSDGKGSTINYVRERDLNLSRPFDQIIASIYRNTDFLNAMKDGALDNNKDLKPAVAAATFTLRLAAIQSGEDANNKNLGLNEYYEAYKDIVKNINSYLKVKKDGSNWVEKWSGVTAADAKRKMFCGSDSSKKECDIDSYYMKQFVKYIAGFKDIKESEEISVSSTDTTTEWNEDNLTYTKTIIGTITGVNSLGDTGYIRFTSKCNKNAVNSCTLYVGPSRDNLAKATKKNYKDSANAEGVLYYKLVIVGNLKKINALSSSNSGSTDLNATFTTKVSSPNIADGVAIVTPSQNVNRQRLVLYPDADSMKEGNDGNSTGSSTDVGSGTSSSSSSYFEEEDGGSLEGEVVNSDGSTIPLVLVNKTYIVGTVVPACDMTKSAMNYKACNGDECPADFDAFLFKAAGCCSYVTDETTGFYEKYCSNKCTYSTLTSVCKYNSKNTTEYDSLVVKEANKAGKEQYTCVVDTDANTTKNTRETYTDSAGNSYEIESYKDNEYCSLSCKEDWDFRLPAMNNYVGANAVRAGSFFMVNDRSVYIKGKRTCVTTYIDYEKYLNDSAYYSEQVWTNFNAWQKAKAEIEAAGTGKTVTNKPYYTNCKWVRAYEDLNLNGNYNDDYYRQCSLSTCSVVTYNKKSGVTYSQDNGVGSTTNTEIAVGNISFDTEYEAGDSSTPGRCEHKSLPDADTPEKKMHEAEEWLTEHQKMIQACQYFQLVTSTSQKVDAQYKQILTVFDPSVSFDYDETEYMKEIGTKNKLQVNKELNDSINKTNGTCRIVNGNEVCINSVKSYYYSSLTNANAYEGVKIGTSDNNLVPSSVEKHNTVRYCTTGYSGIAVVGGNKENAGHTVEVSSNPKCWDHEVDYIEAKYIKKSIENSSFYKNNNYWYINKATDVKTYGESLQSALKQSQLVDDGKWTLYGDSQEENTVFPIKITTARNMYKYSYTLSKIGVYNNDAGTIGRLMGTSNATISSNKRTCFYEVIEDVCLCCGDVIDTEVVAGTTTGELVNASGYDYTMSKNNSSSSSSLSGASVNAEGQLSFFNSTVSLSDLNSDSNRNMGSNWSDKSQYFVSNNTLTTPKGNQLISYIQDKADTIYDETPEYTYTLNPSAMADIRSYNEAHGYQIESSNLISYGTSKIFNNKQNSNWNVNNSDADEEVTFSHYGSAFLEERLSSYVTEGYENKVLSSKKKVCYVIQSEFASKQFSTIRGEANKKSECRWVDYVSNKVTLKDGTTGYSRLSFK